MGFERVPRVPLRRKVVPWSFALPVRKYPSRIPAATNTAPGDWTGAGRSAWTPRRHHGTAVSTYTRSRSPRQADLEIDTNLGANGCVLGCQR